MNEIEAYITTPNGSASDGLELLKTINTPAVMLRICSVANNSFTRGKIRELLSAHLKATAARTVPQSVNTFRNEVKRGVNPSESIAAPPEIKASVAKRKELYGEMRETHARLKMMCFEAHKFINQDRAQTRQQLQRICDEIDVHWKLSKYYDKHRELPPPVIQPELIEITDVNHLVKRRHTLRTYLSPSYITRINNPEKTAAHKTELAATEQKLKTYTPQ
jgi:hypothetical protein